MKTKKVFKGIEHFKLPYVGSLKAALIVFILMASIHYIKYLIHNKRYKGDAIISFQESTISTNRIYFKKL